MKTDTPKVVLSIALMESGKINVSGPLKDKILSYGMLEIAKDVIRSQEVEKNLIEVPNLAIDPNKIGKGN